MKTVKVSKGELLDALKKNREDHRAVFLEAQTNYRVRVIEELDKALEEARSGRQYRTNLHLPPPIDMTKEYDRVMAMLGMSVDDVIELSDGEFRQFVLDDWSWRQQFITANSTYANMPAKFLDSPPEF